MKCYKVVFVEDGKYYSQFVPMGSKLSLEYKLGKTIKADVGKIFVFATLQQATRWCSYGLEVVIECKTRNIQPIFTIAYPIGRDIKNRKTIDDWTENTKSFWKEQKSTKTDALLKSFVTNQLTPVKIV